MLRACDLDHPPLSGHASCEAPTRTRDLATEREREADLRSNIHTAESRAQRGFRLEFGQRPALGKIRDRIHKPNATVTPARRYASTCLQHDIQSPI
jgi:hypothetical protein